MIATAEEMRVARLDVAYRDYCAVRCQRFRGERERGWAESRARESGQAQQRRAAAVHPTLARCSPPGALFSTQHLLIPLNACRHDTFYMPWRCGPERHAYEKCQYVEHLRTVKAKLEG